MRDIFICLHGNMLGNWADACPSALVTAHLQTVPVGEPVLFWLHANANSRVWLERTMDEIVSRFKGSRIVVLANAPDQAEALAVISKGALGYCHAYSSSSVLKELRTVVSHGGIWLGQELLQNLIGASRALVHNDDEHIHQALSMLTPREQEVALQAATGSSNKEIARIFNITERTVKAHISSILERLGLKDRLQLALVLNQKSGSQSNQVKNSSKVKKLKPSSRAVKSTPVPAKKKPDRAAA